jgi:uncharacterized protein (DUF58 family)
MKYLDPVALAKMANLELKVRHVMEGVISGRHASPHKGHSLEFSQHREYSAGDELRHIDWKVFGRSDRFVVKQFQDETNLRAYLLLDASGSLQYASPGNISKLEYASYCAASLAYILLRQQDAAALGIFDTQIRSFLPPHHQLSHLPRLYGLLEKVQAGGETDLAAVLTGLGKHLRRRGLIVILSDLMGDQAGIIRALKYYRSRHHDVAVLHILDPHEIEFPFRGEHVFRDMESCAEVYADADEVGENYRTVFRQFVQEYEIGFRRSGIDYFTVSTATPVAASLNRCLGRERQPYRLLL